MKKYSLEDFIDYCLKNKEMFLKTYEKFEVVVEVKTIDNTSVSRIALFNTDCLNKHDLNEICFEFEHDIEEVVYTEYKLDYFSFNVSESEEDKLKYFKKLDKKLFKKQIEAVNIYIVSMIDKR